MTARVRLYSVTSTEVADAPPRPVVAGSPIVVAVRSPREIVVRGVVGMLQQHPLQVRVLEAGAPLGAADVILCDVSGTDRVATGLDRVATRGRSALVALTSTPSNSSAAAVLRRRVAGVVDMQVSSDDLVTALERAARTIADETGAGGRPERAPMHG